jgi:hypothetical protein
MSGAMTAFRLISLPAHGAVELALGFVLMGSPFVLGFGSAATLVAVVVGALVVGLALNAAVADTGAVDIAAHYAYDLGLAAGLLGAGIVLAISGDAPAALVFLAGAAVQLALNVTTRYSARH